MGGILARDRRQKRSRPACVEFLLTQTGPRALYFQNNLAVADLVYTRVTGRRKRRASRRAVEVDLLGRHRPGRAPRRRLVGPVEVGVRDDLLRRRRPPGGLVLGGVGVADQG